MASARDVQELLEDRPDLEPALEAVLEPDPPWTFQDVDVDSGAFGELVSRELVEDYEDGYRVADPDAVQRALDGDVGETDPSRDLDLDFSWPDLKAEVRRLELGALTAGLVLVVLFRLTSYASVFRADAIVLSSNDPYYYRYLLEELLTNPETTFSTLSIDVLAGEPLMLAVLWAVTIALGGTTDAAATVLAWYPIASALVTAVMIYVAAVLVTDDRRIGLASVAMLAVLPAHAFRTSVGFADHHAFDYPWLALTLLGVLFVIAWTRAREESSSSLLWLVAGVGAVAVGVTGQTLAWEAGPLLIVALGLTIATMTITAVHRGESVFVAVAPLVLGVAIAAGATWFVHTTYDWHTTLVASSPLMLAIGSAGVLATGVAWNRTDLPVIGLVVVDALGATISALALRSIRPDFWERMVTEVTERLLAPREIAEFQSLFSDSAGWLLLFGFLLVLALPYMAWASREALADDRWTPLVVYAWYFLVLAAISVRFAGQLSIFVAVFAGLGFVHLAAWIDVARRPAPFTGEIIESLTLPDRRQAFSLVGLFLLVAGLSMLQVPVKTSQITSPNDGYDAAAWMAEYSDEHDMEYPENYVFSQWGHNRMYNYFVNGESQSYSFAQSNYEDFVTGTNATAWHDRLQNRVGFVVTTRSVVSNESTIGTRLHAHNGSRSEFSPGLGQYRLVHVEDDGAYKVFTLVDGAVITGETEPNADVTVRTTVELDAGFEFSYVRETTANANGTFEVRLAHPGEYSVAGETVTVPESAVQNGTTVTVNATDSTANASASSNPVRPSTMEQSIRSTETVTAASVDWQRSIRENPSVYRKPVRL